MTTSFEIIAPTGNRSLFIFGDHASRHIPQAYENLGLNGDDLTRHIAWDIGTAQIIRGLCAHFGCAGQIAGVSRLVVDLNRDLNAAGLIPEISDGTIIVGNQNLSSSERADRVERFYTPYHTALGESLDALDKPFVLSIHSFTPRPLTGEQRETDIGLLVKHDYPAAEPFAKSFTAPESLRAQDAVFGRALKAAINKPYSAYDLNYTVDAHVAPRGLRHLAIEIRQDLIDTYDGCAVVTSLLIDHLEALMAEAL